jgi:hypothetical protein
VKRPNIDFKFREVLSGEMHPINGGKRLRNLGHLGITCVTIGQEAPSPSPTEVAFSYEPYWAPNISALGICEPSDDGQDHLLVGVSLVNMTTADKFTVSNPLLPDGERGISLYGHQTEITDISLGDRETMLLLRQTLALKAEDFIDRAALGI